MLGVLPGLYMMGGDAAADRCRCLPQALRRPEGKTDEQKENRNDGGKAVAHHRGSGHPEPPAAICRAGLGGLVYGQLCLQRFLSEGSVPWAGGAGRSAVVCAVYAFHAGNFWSGLPERCLRGSDLAVDAFADFAGKDSVPNRCGQPMGAAVRIYLCHNLRSGRVGHGFVDGVAVPFRYGSVFSTALCSICTPQS